VAKPGAYAARQSNVLNLAFSPSKISIGRILLRISTMPMQEFARVASVLQIVRKIAEKT